MSPRVHFPSSLLRPPSLPILSPINLLLLLVDDGLRPVLLAEEEVPIHWTRASERGKIETESATGNSFDALKRGERREEKGREKEESGSRLTSSSKESPLEHIVDEVRHRLADPGDLVS